MDTNELIVRQVAFKGAIEALPEHVKWIIKDGEGQPDAKQLVGAVRFLTEEFSKIILKQNDVPQVPNKLHTS